MEYDSKRVKTISSDERRCPYCNSLNLKEYLYGEPTSNYDLNKYVLGGCEVSPDNPRYKCSDCGRDIYLKSNIKPLNLTMSDFNSDNSEYIIINYSDKTTSYNFKLTKNKVIHSGIEEYISSICLVKKEYNSVYKIDDVQNLENEEFDKYYNKLMKITSNWIKEFDNNELVSNGDIREWSLTINTKDNQLDFSNEKVPSNINELYDVIIELEELYKKEFEKSRNKISELINNSFNLYQQKSESSGNNENKYLKRDDFIKLADSDKIWSKSMTLLEVNNLLTFLEKEIGKYNYNSDKNFFMDGRRKGLKSGIVDKLLINNNNINEVILESLFNFWEFVNKEYCVPSFDTMEQLHLSGDEILKMWDEYKKSGIICFEEKELILEMIIAIKSMIDISKK